MKSATVLLGIIPQPVELKSTGGTFELKADAVVAYADAAARLPAELLAAQLRPATGFDLPVRSGTEGAIVFRTLKDPSRGKEGYALRITDYARLSAPSPAGLFYGAQTLRQLLPPEIYSPREISRVWNMPTVEIRDLPRFGWRGLHLDVCRHFMPKKEVLRFIDTMATLKFNTFHWHLTEDQGWRIEIRKYPELTGIGAWRNETLAGHDDDRPRTYDGIRHGGFYTQDDIREIVAYAAERHITIVPEIDMPGHMQAAIAAYPELGCTGHQPEVGTEWGISEDILNPEESTVRFFQDVLTEVMDLFPSEFIHIGGDEAPKTQWEASGRIQQLRKERGLDIAKKAAEEGHDIVVASSGNLYFDHYQSEDKESEPLAIGGFLPLEAVYAFEPVIEGLDETTASHILGVQGQLWTEYMPDMKQVEYMAFPRACALAELAWLPKEKKDYADFLRRMKVQEQRFEAAGVNFRKTENSLP